jgi:hypothetical protein
MERYYEGQFKELRDLLLRMSYLAVENFTHSLEVSSAASRTSVKP